MRGFEEGFTGPLLCGSAKLGRTSQDSPSLGLLFRGFFWRAAAEIYVGDGHNPEPWADPKR